MPGESSAIIILVDPVLKELYLKAVLKEHAHILLDKPFPVLS